MKQLLLLPVLCFLCCCGEPKHTVKQAAGNPPANLTNTRWVLKSLPSSTVPKMEKDIYIEFQPNGAVKGFAGCNGFTGIYVINTKVLTISRLLSTKMWCDKGSVETQFLKALEQAKGFTISGDELHLAGKGGEVAMFHAVYLK